MVRPTENRLRQPPMDRFAPAEHVVNVYQEARKLLHEPNGGQHGHRQKAVVREGPLTVALYHFEAGSRLPDHVVDGLELIQVLEGELVIATDREEHRLPTGALLRLAPGIRHDVSAVQASLVLRTVVLMGPESHAA